MNWTTPCFKERSVKKNLSQKETPRFPWLQSPSPTQSMEPHGVSRLVKIRSPSSVSWLFLKVSFQKDLHPAGMKQMPLPLWQGSLHVEEPRFHIKLHPGDQTPDPIPPVTLQRKQIFAACVRNLILLIITQNS